MIPRYTRPEMGRIWSDRNKFQQWLEVELAASEALAQLGVVPAEAARLLREHAGFDVERIHEIEREVKHDVIAFTTAVAETMQARGHGDVVALVSLRPDVERRGGYRAGAAVAAGVGHPARRPDAVARSAQAAGAGVPAHGADRPHARGTRGANHVRAEAGHLVRRSGAQSHAVGRGGRGSARRQDIGRGRHLRPHRPGNGGADLREAEPEARGRGLAR